MNKKFYTSTNSTIQEKLLFGSLAHTGYLWENLAIEASKSSTLIYKGNIVDALWAVFTSRVT